LGLTAAGFFFLLLCDESIEVALVLEERLGGVPGAYGPGTRRVFAGFGVV
jgi:hypothetical protein